MHQWYWSFYFDCLQSISLSNLFSDGDFEFYLESTILLLQSNAPIVKLSLVKSDDTSTNLVSWIPKFETSKNHDDTLAVLDKALNSDLFSIEVRNFISANRDKIYSSLCFVAKDVLIPIGLSLGTTGPLFDLNQKSGIYCITCNSTNEKYIGSAINLAARLRGHQDLGQSQKWQTANHLLYNKIYNLGPHDFTFSVIHSATNFLKLFKELNPTISLTIKDVQLLEAFTKYELARMEQSYLGEFKPELNGRHVATTSTHPHLLTPMPDETLTYEIPTLLEGNTNFENSTIELGDITPIVDLSHLDFDPIKM